MKGTGRAREARTPRFKRLRGNTSRRRTCSARGGLLARMRPTPSQRPILLQTPQSSLPYPAPSSGLTAGGRAGTRQTPLPPRVQARRHFPPPPLRQGPLRGHLPWCRSPQTPPQAGHWVRPSDFRQHVGRSPGLKVAYQLTGLGQGPRPQERRAACRGEQQVEVSLGWRATPRPAGRAEGLPGDGPAMMQRLGEGVCQFRGSQTPLRIWQMLGLRSWTLRKQRTRAFRTRARM
jgi:hypothetical protein